MSQKTLLVIAAVAVMLAGATSASAYYEMWDGWFNGGYLDYGGNRYNYNCGEGYLEDNTDGDKDTFYVSFAAVSTFTATGVGYIMLWPHTASGYKYTGQSGYKPSYNGAWEGTAIVYISDEDPVIIDVWGPWATTYNDFNYVSDPDSYNAGAGVNSVGQVLTGYCTSAGERQ